MLKIKHWNFIIWMLLVTHHWRWLTQCQIIVSCSHIHNREVFFSHMMHYFRMIAVSNLKASLKVVKIVLNKAYLSVPYDITLLKNFKSVFNQEYYGYNYKISHPIYCPLYHPIQICCLASVRNGLARITGLTYRLWWWWLLF